MKEMDFTFHVITWNIFMITSRTASLVLLIVDVSLIDNFKWIPLIHQNDCHFHNYFDELKES